MLQQMSGENVFFMVMQLASVAWRIVLVVRIKATKRKRRPKYYLCRGNT